ncbi:uncharacterized protein DUF3877 [Kineothrix alysoides]|uniref:Uncharacterized protein DUF3877 n=1 Tax=Kineothrix alysoides TaxID=1469948 RepID=A0A4R1QTW1_9FIRM|nr:uncharacterized protein DUF3877 [Kineothrix alysoides]
MEELRLSYEKLEKNIIDIIKEEQAKLGYRKETVRLYYPLRSLNHFFDDEYGIRQMKELLQVFCQQVRDKLGDIQVTNEKDRFCFAIPEKGVEYIHDNMDKNEFIKELVETVQKHGCTIEDILNIFCSYSQDIHFEKVDNGEFNYLIYFKDQHPDSYYYCFTVEEGHIIYHRFLQEDYEDFGF